jgi:hypothetical protein
MNYENSDSLVLKQIYDYMIMKHCKSNRTRRKSTPVYCFDDADFVTTRYGFKKRVIIEPNFY